MERKDPDLGLSWPVTLHSSKHLCGSRTPLGGSIEMLNNLQELVGKFQMMEERAGWVKICDFCYN